MKRIVILLAVLVFALGSATAQTYGKLWQEAEQAQAKDLPKTALASIRKIQEKAVQEGNAGQLLRACLTARQMGQQLSPDTAQAMLDRMEAQLKATENPVEKALWHAALARTYEAARFFRYSGQNALTPEETERKITGHYAASMADIEVLARTSYKDYLPLFRPEEDSRLYYNDDLLHILTSTFVNASTPGQKDKKAVLERVADLYLKQGKNNAYVLTTLNLLSLEYGYRQVSNRPLEEDEYYGKLAELARAYPLTTCPASIYTYTAITGLKDHSNGLTPYLTHNDSLLLNWAQKGLQHAPKGEVRNVLTNFVANCQTTSASLHDLPQTGLPGQVCKLQLHVRNASKIVLRSTPIFLGQTDYRRSLLNPRNKRQKVAGRQVGTLSVAVPAAPEYAWQKVAASLSLPALPGIYELVLIADGKVLDTAVYTVSSVDVMDFVTAPGNNRITVVNRQDGTPIPHAKVTLYNQDNKGNLRQIKVFETGTDGTVTIRTDAFKQYRNLECQTSTAEDKASPLFRLSNLTSYVRNLDDTQVSTDIFTDRAIYRPGQKVQFNAVSYTRKGDDIRTLEGQEAKVYLSGSNGRTLDSLLVKTDSWGSFAGQFVLPQTTLPGNFLLTVMMGNKRFSQHFKVEVYKRPTFTSTTLPVTDAYALGDSVHVVGKATTFTGLPVGGARVQYRVTRSAHFYWNRDEFEPQSGETTTDEDGTFRLPVWLAYNARQGYTPRQVNRYYYRVEYTVTADNGETSQGSALLRAATQPAWIETHIPDAVCRKKGQKLPPLKADVVNAAGRTLDADGTYSLLLQDKEMAHGTFKSGVPFTLEALSALPSGVYSLRLKAPGVVPAEADTCHLRMTLFSEDEHRPLDKQNPCFTYRETNAEGDSVLLLMGTPKAHVMLYIDVLANDKNVRSERVTLSDSIYAFRLAYDPAYGDGATAYLAMMVDGKLYHETVSVVKPQPEKSLVMQWESFRSRLTPGSQEVWKLRVTHPDGTPAEAQILAGMYDASLDVLAKNNWTFSGIYFGRRLPYALLNHPSNSVYMLSGTAPYKNLSEHYLQFTHWREGLFDALFYPRYALDGSVKGIRVRGSRNQVMMSELSSDQMRLGAAAPKYETALKKESKAVSRTDEDMDAGAAESTTANSGTAPSENVKVRTNFDETAFFKPALTCDENGVATLSFTLPESTTEWNVMALAYDRNLNHGRLDTTVIARKEWMVQPAMPRFLRQGDAGSLPVSISNLTGSDHKAQLTLTLVEAVSGKVCHTQSMAVEVPAGGTRTFSLPMDNKLEAGVYICRVTAAGKGYSDGEEHYLPVLSTDVEVTRTLPFSLHDKGDRTLRIDTLFNVSGSTHRTLTMELSSNPVWYAVSALPVLADGSQCLSATQWATRYYALGIGRRIASDNPEIRRIISSYPAEADALAALQTEGLTDATPWLKYGETEQQRMSSLRKLFDSDRTAALLYTVTDKLRALQGTDGSWSWYPGMPGNELITTEVAILLARTEIMGGEKAGNAMLNRAMDYLRKQMSKQVEAMKKAEKKQGKKMVPSEAQLRYLYLRSLLSMKPDNDALFILDRAEKMQQDLSLYGKAINAIVLADAGRKASAELQLKGLIEHTMTGAEMGRWFDSPRALSSSRSYRIPTQCAAIEALQRMGRTTEAHEMRLWLLQSKRTQLWETNRATTDAIYALLAAANQPAAASAPSANAPALKVDLQTSPLYYTLYKGKEIVGLNTPKDTQAPATAGYVKQAYTDAKALKADRVTLHKQDDGLSWGCVYASFMAPASTVKTEGKGLAVSRRFEVKTGDEWVNVNASTTVQKGDRIRQVLTVKSDRDMDFVSVKADRPTCFEPVRPLSGYGFSSGVAAYRAMNNDHTMFFIEKLSKGTHTLVEEYFADKSGQYATGLVRTECVYSPEFTATAAETRIRVK